MSENRPTLIILSTGKEDGGRKATIGFAIAVSSVSMGVDTSIFLTGGATVWGQPHQSREICVDGFESLDTYITNFLKSGGHLMVCSPCLKFYCGLNLNNIESSSIYDKIEFAGITTVADMISTHSVVNF